MTIEDFKEKSEEWLKEFGYSVHFHSSNYKQIGFWNTNDKFAPGITCFFEEGAPTVQISSVHFKMFTLSSGRMSFGNPLIGKHIQVAKHYATLADQYPPF